MGPMFISKSCLLSPIDGSLYENRLVYKHSYSTPKRAAQTWKGLVMARALTNLLIFNPFFVTVDCHELKFFVGTELLSRLIHKFALLIVIAVAFEIFAVTRYNEDIKFQPIEIDFCGLK
jgi:hypothetical protein